MYNVKKMFCAVVFVSGMFVGELDAKPVNWRSRSSAMKKCKNGEIKALWKEALTINKTFKSEKDEVKKKEITKKRNVLFMKIDSMLALENPNYKKLVDAAMAK